MPLLVRTLPNQRFTCQACGRCCRHLALGPVEPALVADAQVAAVGRTVADPWYHRWDEGIFLATRNGACVFLDADQGCRLHAALGPTRKPAFCREFPFFVLKDPRGLVVLARPDCPYVLEGTGPRIEALILGILALPRPWEIPVFAPLAVGVLLGMAVPLQAWMTLEDALMELVEAEPPPSPEVLVARIRAFVYRALRRTEPLAGPSPWPALRARFEALAGRPLPEAPPDPLRDAAFRHAVQVTIMGKRFLEVGGLPDALGLLLADVRFAPAFSPCVRLPVALSDWWRFTDTAAVQKAIRGLRPLLADAFLGAGDPAVSK